MSLISPLTRARAGRLVRTFQEVHAETGSLMQAIGHTARLVRKKLVPLVRYGLFTLKRIVLSRRLKRLNRRGATIATPIALRILGGVGDYIVIARFVRDLAAEIEPATFDIYSNRPRIAAWIFAAVPGFRWSFDEGAFSPAGAGYALAAQISQFVLIETSWIARGALEACPRLGAVIAAVARFRPGIEPIIAEHPRLDSFLAQKAVFANRGRRDYLHLMAGLAYAGDRLDISFSDARGLTADLSDRLYVTVHNGYDPNMIVSHVRATKCYPHFGEVIKILRAERPDILFVQVGIHTSELIAEADINLIGTTSLPQVAALLRGALFHIDNEGGLVHLASAMGTRSCVVFGPTSSRYFGYPRNVNVDPSFCGGCWWITETWMNHCPRGFATARCMTEQPPSVVARAAATLLESVRLPLDAVGVAE